MQAINDLLSTGKGAIAIVLLIGATVLTALGRMTVDQWTNFAEWIFGIYAGAKAATTVASTIASRPASLPTPAPSSTGATTNVVVTPPAEVTKQAGFARVGLLVLLASMGLALAAAGGCGASARETALRASLATAKVTVATLDAYTAQHELEIARTATSHEDGDAKLAAYEKKLAVVDKAVNVLLDAIATAAVANDTPTLAAVAPAALALKQAFDELRAATGGAQ